MEHAGAVVPLGTAQTREGVAQEDAALQAALAAEAAAERELAATVLTPEQQRERADAAVRRRETHGSDPNTQRQIKYVAGKFSTWLTLHGAAYDYSEGDEVTVELLRKFVAFCAVNSE